MKWKYLALTIGGDLHIAVGDDDLEPLYNLLVQKSYDVELGESSINFSKSSFGVDLLDCLGAEGWELVTAQTEKQFTSWWFKQPVE